MKKKTVLEILEKHLFYDILKVQLLVQCTTIEY